MQYLEKFHCTKHWELFVKKPIVNHLSPLTLPPRLDQMFSDAFSKDHQLIRADPKHSLYLACALMVRGNVQVSDLRRNIERSEHHPPTPSPSSPSQFIADPHSHSQIVPPFSTNSSDSWLVHSAPLLRAAFTALPVDLISMWHVVKRNWNRSCCESTYLCMTMV